MIEDPNRIHGFMRTNYTIIPPVLVGFTNLLRVIYNLLLLKSLYIVNA